MRRLLWVDRVLRPDGRVEDVGDFSDFYVQPETDMRATEKKSLQELQDEVTVHQPPQFITLHTQDIVS